jgi:hypothetical protein
VEAAASAAASGATATTAATAARRCLVSGLQKNEQSNGERKRARCENRD